MSVVNFSVPDDVKRAFDAAFAGKNKSAVVATLMRQAVDEQERARRRRRAIDALLALRTRARPTVAGQVRRARKAGRP